MGLPVCMLRPVSFLEDLSVFLDYIYLLYSEEQKISVGMLSSFSTLSYDQKIHYILRYVLATQSHFYTVLIEIFKQQDIHFPCNPIVGETFASYVFVNDIRVSFVAEEQSNRPNTSLFIIQDDHNLFQLQGSIQPKQIFVLYLTGALFGGSSILQEWRGSLTLRYLPTGESVRLQDD